MPNAIAPPAGTVNPHGPQSFFGDLAIDGLVSNAIPLPSGGILDFLPRTNGSLPNNLIYSILTGVTEEAPGAAVTDCCLPPSHTTGLTQLCSQVAEFGRMAIVDKGISFTCFTPPNPCETTDVRIVGNPLVNNNNSGIINGVSTGGNLNTVEGKRMFELYASLIRQYAPTVWSADGADTGDVTWCPPKGLDSLIHDNHVDVKSGTACERANSYIIDAGLPDVCTQAGVESLYQNILNMWYTLNDRADKFGFGQTQWIPSCHPTLFRILTRMWPYVMHATGACYKPDGNSAIRFDLTNASAEQKAMMDGSFLWIDNVAVPFLLDDTVPVTQAAIAGPPASLQNDSSIWFVPFSIRGGTPVTFVDYSSWNKAYELGDSEMMKRLAEANGQVVDNGRWLMLRENYSNGCGGQLSLWTRPRILLYTPQIAGKIINIRWTPDYQYTEWNPAALNYVSGGVTAQP